VVKPNTLGYEQCGPKSEPVYVAALSKGPTIVVQCSTSFYGYFSSLPQSQLFELLKLYPLKIYFILKDD